MAEMKGKVALVTGAANGIGRATALAFASRGASVVLADTDEAGIRALANEIVQAGGAAIAVSTNVGEAEQCRNMVEATRKRFGRLDMAFNNAGISGGGPDRADVATYDLDVWRKVMDVNLSGVFYCTKYELPLMLESGGGVIVNTSSIMGFRSSPNIAAYVAAKHGVLGLTKVVCEEYAARNIRCNAVAPGVVETPMTSRFFENADIGRAALATIPQSRFGQPNDLAEAVVWLCSPAAAYVNGVCLPVDGGFLAR
ncbi:SDR family NAD(P)-dependent oxidoreductase [Aminobacter carboxidus]|uniref:Glucose 1-dehydrogenase n=1 Tax=Aminobacter carboxidus TaxID=376165 RepID=A0ABR9GK69_9HYPH|nr:glucose 1-dehydrogenase [Aminobacter carboxidus]MBE1204065.1 glucose 1-dehydrogenase [Aminobacter carboxidus]